MVFPSVYKCLYLDCSLSLSCHWPRLLLPCNCHTPIPSTVTLPFPQLSHSHSLNCHTPIPSTVTLPFPQLSHSHSLKTSHVQYITGPTLIRVSPLSFKHHNHTPHCHTPTSSTVTHLPPVLSPTPHPHHHTFTITPSPITLPDGGIR